MRQKQPDTRAAVSVVDVLMTFFVLVAIIVLYPHFNKFIGMVSSEADPFSAVLIQLMVPLLLVGLVVSVAISAKRGV